MDLSTMRSKILRVHAPYRSIGAFECDIKLMVENCRVYNGPNSILARSLGAVCILDFVCWMASIVTQSTCAVEGLASNQSILSGSSWSFRAGCPCSYKWFSDYDQNDSSCSCTSTYWTLFICYCKCTAPWGARGMHKTPHASKSAASTSQAKLRCCFSFNFEACDWSEHNRREHDWHAKAAWVPMDTKQKTAWLKYLLVCSLYSLCETKKLSWFGELGNTRRNTQRRRTTLLTNYLLTNYLELFLAPELEVFVTWARGLRFQHHSGHGWELLKGVIFF